MYAVAAALLVIVAYPLILVISCSFSSPELVATGKITLLPREITFDGYREILKNKDILIGFVNSVFYMVLGTMFDLFVTVPAGYVLTKRQLPATSSSRSSSCSRCTFPAASSRASCS